MITVYSLRSKPTVHALHLAVESAKRTALRQLPASDAEYDINVTIEFKSLGPNEEA